MPLPPAFPGFLTPLLPDRLLCCAEEHTVQPAAFTEECDCS